MIRVIQYTKLVAQTIDIGIRLGDGWGISIFYYVLLVFDEG